MAGDGGDPLQAAQALRTGLDGVVRRLAARSFTDADVRAILAGLVDDGLDGRYRDYAGAEQATMAMAGVMDYLAKHRALADLRGANAALDRVYDAVKDDQRYQPERYRAALADLRKALAP